MRTVTVDRESMDITMHHTWSTVLSILAVHWRVCLIHPVLWLNNLSEQYDPTWNKQLQQWCRSGVMHCTVISDWEKCARPKTFWDPHTVYESAIFRFSAKKHWFLIRKKKHYYSSLVNPTLFRWKSVCKYSTKNLFFCRKSSKN